MRVPDIPYGLQKTIESMDGSYDEDVAAAVLDCVADGMTLAAACLHLGVKVRWVRRWIVKDEGHNPPMIGMREMYRQARSMQAEAWGDEIIEIADDAPDDGEQKAKLRIDTRKWLMSKADERYLDKATTIIEGGVNPVRVIHSVEELRKRLEERGLPTRLLIEDDETE